MHKIKSLLILAFILFQAYNLEISNIHLQDQATTSSLHGSVMGGTKLYIQGLGFSLTMGQNEVWIGNQYQCHIQDGATATSLLCTTSPTDGYRDLNDLNIVVTTVGQGSITAAQKFSYKTSQTPYFNYIFPSVSYGGNGTFLWWNGIQRIADLGSDKILGDVYGLYIGDKSICSRFGVYQEQINPNANSFIQCYQPTRQKAGKYNVSEHLFPGRSYSPPLTYKASQTNQVFQFVVLPLVNATTSSGSINGQQMQIKGTGFSTDPADMNVKVDGIDCKITESTLSEIKCRLDPQDPSKSTKLQSSVGSSPKNPYYSGSGYFYQRWNINGLSDQTAVGFKAALDANSLSNSAKIDEKISGQIKTADVWGTYYGQVWKGYFVPTKTGNHIFRGIADDSFAVYLNKNTYGSTQPLTSSHLIAGNDTWTAATSFFNFETYYNLNAQSAPIALEAGKAYYMEVYHVNKGSVGIFSLAVQIPNTDATIKRWNTHQVQSVSISITQKPEIIQFASQNATSGTFILKYYATDANMKVTNINTTVKWNATAQQFCNALNIFPWFNLNTYGITCSSKYKTSGGGLTNNAAQAAIYIWRVTIAKYRNEAARARAFSKTQYTDPKGSFSETLIQQHSPPLSGTFALFIGGVAIELNGDSRLPYDISSTNLRNAIRNTIVGMDNVQVEKIGDTLASPKWVIYYFNYNQDPPEVVGSTLGLQGGMDGTVPQITTATVRPYSKNLFVNPIDYRWMRTYSNKPSVLVTVDGILSACNMDTNCGYTFLDTTGAPTLKSFSVTGYQATMTLTDPTNLQGAMPNSAVTLLSIAIGGQNCFNIVGQLGAANTFTCQLNHNVDNTPILTAGSYYPDIYIKDLGYAIIDTASAQKFDYALSVTSYTPTAGQSNGGYQITLQGQGFPPTSSEISIKLCNKQCMITSINNQQIKFIVPPCAQGANQIEVKVGTVTPVTKPFTYNAPSNLVTITGIQPTSWSPVLKGVMTITGSGFGATQQELDDLQVWMTNSTGNIYQMRILSASATQIKVGIPGGLPGPFDINVIHKTLGYATPATPTANDFKYEVYITSVTPTTGSFYGGTLITITGVNFVDDKSQTMVTIGDQINQICNIQTISTTQITCRTPPKHADDPTLTNLQVEVMSKLIIPTNCSVGANCWFQYEQSANSPSLSALATPTTNLGASFTATGIRLNGDVQIVLKNKLNKQQTAITPTSFTSTSVNFVYPQGLPASNYAAVARCSINGDSNPIDISIDLIISTSSPKQISVNGGQVTLQGRGFPDSWPNKFFRIGLALNGQNLPLNIVTYDGSKIKVIIPKGQNGLDYILTITPPIGAVKTFTIQQRSTATPTVNLKVQTSSIAAGGDSTVILTRTVLTTAKPSIIELYSIANPNFKITYTTTDYTQSSDDINLNVNLNTGYYGFNLYDTTYGWWAVTDTSLLQVQKDATAYTCIPTIVSYNGGKFKITGANIGQGAIIKVGGLVGTYIQRVADGAWFNVPKFLTTNTKNLFGTTQTKKINIMSKNTWADSLNEKKAFDGKHSSIYQSANATCYIGVDFGIGVQISKITYFPNPNWDIASKYIKGGVFEASIDNSTWTLLATIDQTVHAGWNSFMINNNYNLYKHFRFRHTSDSGCKLAQIQVTGLQMSSDDISNVNAYPVDVIFQDGKDSHTQTLSDCLTFQMDHTPIVTDVQPRIGHVEGGYTITITGSNLDLDTPDIKIDNIPCAIVSSSSTQIICTVGARTGGIPQSNTFIIQYGDITAITQKTFKYVYRWSDPDTWGLSLPPVEGDLVYVPQGMHLLVDQSTPILKGIIVQNATIQFQDVKPMIISTDFITLRGGQFIAGTSQNPHTNSLTFIMYGDYYGIQQPMFGNKGIGCLQCKFSMYGQPKDKTWTLLQNTINPGDITLTLLEDVHSWVVGDQIVVASTSYDHNEAQKRTIVSISGGKSITVDKPFTYKHYAGEQTFGTEKLQMRAEVGLLTRKIKMMGDFNSVKTQYGSHLMLAGKQQNGLVGHIAYVQFTKCGQPQIVGRYCHHFHLNGDIPQSYSIGNSVHDSFARILTIHGVHYLYVAWNVGYRVKGHNFFLEDGIQTNNVLEYNLAISSLLINNMLQTDMSVASYWVTNPSNYFRHNRAAGSDFYGFWYQIKEHPDGPSATDDICPIGNPMGQARNNTAHSNVRFGLRIFQLYSRQNPCDPIRDDTQLDPWAANPSIQSKFEQFYLWKNGQSGLLAEQTGHVTFQKFIIAQSKLAAVQFWKTNFTKYDTVAKNFAIIGKSDANGPVSISELDGSIGIILSRTGRMKVEDIRFYNFESTMTVWQACSRCFDPLVYTNTGAVYAAQQIFYHSSVLGKFFNMLGLQRQIFYDLDGSLTNGKFITSVTDMSSGTLVKGFPHILQDPACKSATDSTLWDNAAFCDSTVKLHHIFFTGLINIQEFRSKQIKARMIANIDQITALTETVFTSAYSLHPNKQPMKQIKLTYSLPYIAGRMYNIWWSSGIDFRHFSMRTSPYYPQNEKGVIFKFNYTASRQLFDISPLRQTALFNASLMKTQKASKSVISANDCNNGDYFHDNVKGGRFLELCASGKNRTYAQYMNVTAIICRHQCPPPPGSCNKQNFVRKWNNASQWPGQRMPTAGQNVTIECPWNVQLDMDPVQIGVLHVYGNLTVPDTKDFIVQAQTIWIIGGNITAGTKQQPFTHKLTFQINGLKQDDGITVSPQLAGNKMFVNTGGLYLYGVTPNTIWTRLYAFADAGATQIQVQNPSGWAVGDTIGISPSFMKQTEYQVVTITAISGNTLTISPPLKFNHYGHNDATVAKHGYVLDTRTGVAHLNRNIKITAGPDNGWGFTLVQHSFLRHVVDQTYQYDTNVIQTGRMQLSGVQFIKGGQYNTVNAGLQILNVKTQTKHTLIQKSSFRDCQDLCARVQDSVDVQFNNNVFFNAKRFHMRALDIKKFTFTNNLMIGVRTRNDMIWNDLLACFASYNAVNPQTDQIAVHDNLCQGSQGHGFAVPHVECNDIDIYPFSGNTVGSAQFGWIFARGIGDCLSAKGCMAYSTQVGNIHDPLNGYVSKFKNFLFADNTRAMTIRLGGDIPDKTGYVYDSYISAISRPSCTKCYGPTANQCTKNQAMRMLTTGLNAQQLPTKFGYVYDVVCKAQTIDGKVFIYNTEFENFRQVYNNDVTNLPQCSGNVIFKPHPIGTSFVASHHLWNTICTNCQLEAMASFDPPPKKELGWFGGCGDILCTGFNNYFIQDHTSTFLPQSTKAYKSLLANNSWIGDNQPTCDGVPQINGHICTNTDFAVLAYESIAPDFNTRIMWPVYLTYDGANYTTQTNGWREWQWAGSQPLNRRLGRFVSVIRLGKMYNMTFVSMPPEDMTFRIQKKTPEGSNDDYVIVKIYYPKPNSIRVQVGGKTVAPIVLREDGVPQLLDVTKCGSNKYFFRNNTIHFVVTGHPDCKVRVSLTTNIQLTAKFDMDIKQFYDDKDLLPSLISRMAALLQINDVSRIKVVGLYEGSTFAQFTVQAPTLSIDQSVGLDPAQAQALAAQKLAVLQALVQNVINTPEFVSQLSDALGGAQVITIGAQTTADGPVGCLKHIQVDEVDICTNCSFGFTLTDVFLNGVRQTRCLSNEDEYIDHCNHVDADDVNGIYQCASCNAGYTRIKVDIDGVTFMKCISDNQFVPSCDTYILEQKSCSFLCSLCQDDLQLVNVRIKSRTYGRCLVKDVQALPYCDLHIYGADNVYYCKSKHCSANANQIKIGALDYQVACTPYALIGPDTNNPATYGQCAIYRRPQFDDTANVFASSCTQCKVPAKWTGNSCSTAVVASP